MRISVLGPPGCGKSSLISALFGLTEHDNRASCDNGVTVHTWEWRPQGEDADDKGRELVEIWEWSGKKIFRGLQSFFYTGSPLYLLCLSVDDMEAADDLLQTWMDIHYKISSPDVVIIFTQCFGKTRTANYHGIRAELVNRIKKIQKSVSGTKTKGNLIFESLTKLEKSLVSDSQPEVVIRFVDLHQRKGISEVKFAIQKLIKSKADWHTQFTKEHSSVTKIVRNIRSYKTALMNESDFLQVMKETKADEDIMDFLESKVINCV